MAGLTSDHNEIASASVSDFDSDGIGTLVPLRIAARRADDARLTVWVGLDDTGKSCSQFSADLSTISIGRHSTTVSPLPRGGQAASTANTVRQQSVTFAQRPTCTADLYQRLLARCCATRMTDAEEIAPGMVEDPDDLPPPVLCYTVRFVQALAYAPNGRTELRQTLGNARRDLLVRPPDGSTSAEYLTAPRPLGERRSRSSRWRTTHGEVVSVVRSGSLSPRNDTCEDTCGAATHDI